ncbi:MAG: transcriptional repressor LexA [Phycisphaerae bacterium]|jgi:repressor LexA|nr:transcriptional repressor LexA [Phycisphaerae bacterium]
MTTARSRSGTATPRQLEILKYIRGFRIRNGYSPTMQEIGDHLALTKVTVFEHVAALEKKGLLLRGEKHKARSLQVSDSFEFSDESALRMPLVGQIAAGMPLEAIEDTQSLDLGEMFPHSSDTFALRVVGDSMIDEQIREGDYVICRRTNSARDGETVVALFEDGEATLKKFFREKNGYRLQPANKAYDPIYVDNLEIQGVVVGVVRTV